LLYTFDVFVLVKVCMRSRILKLPALALTLALAGCAWLKSQEDVTRDWSVTKLYAEAASELDSGNYQTAIEHYEKLEARYPFGRYAMQAQLDVAYAYYRAEEPEAAIAAADRFIKLYPQNPFVDYAYYLKGIINYNRSVGFLDRYIPTDPSQRDPGSALDSFEDFDELVRRFPDSRYAPDARQRMLYLRNNLAKHEVNVARYYVKRGAYLAAVERCNHVIKHFQRTSAVKSALEVMIDAYERLGKDKLAADARRVLALNEQEGRFLSDEPEPGEVSLSRKIWDYLELDKN
jgi:outer membrane protein assembly factor BamD